MKDRRTLFSVMLADLFVVAGALFVMHDRHQALSGRVEAYPAAQAMAPADAVTPRPAPAAATVKATTASTAPRPVLQSGTAPSGGRNILFSYRNSKPGRVEIIGSFNDWTPQPMRKGKNHTWTASFTLPPGDHTYNYIADGKVLRDPNNPRTAPEGRSLLTIKPLAQ